MAQIFADSDRLPFAICVNLRYQRANNFSNYADCAILQPKCNSN